MAFPNLNAFTPSISGIRRKVGNAVDQIGTSVNLPEIGLSELLAGGRTANTGATAQAAAPQFQSSVFPQTPGRNLETFYDPNAELQAMLASVAPSGGGSGGAAATDYGVKTLPDGRIFNLNDPSQRLAYSQALQQVLGSQRDQALAAAQDAFATGDRQAVQQYQQYISQLDQNLADVGAQAKQYVQDYQKTLTGFNEGKASGDIGRQSYFASISPNAFQSSQSSSQAAAEDKYAQGLADLTSQAQSTVGLDYLSNPDAGVNAFDPNSQFGRNVASIGTQRQGLETSFNDYRTSALQGLQKNQSAIGQSFQDSVNSQNATLGQVDLAQGKNPFQYGVSSVQPFQAPKADVSQYSQYTNFNSLANPAAQGSAYVKPTYASNSFSQPSVDAYLNRTNTKLSGTQSNAFMKYLQGKAS